MKLRKLSSVLVLALAVLAIGCKPENVGPKGNGSDTGLSTETHGCLALPCSSQVYEFVVPGWGISNAGELVISNNKEELVLCGRSFIFSELYSVAVWYGDGKSTLPLNEKGQADIAQFPVVYRYETPVSKITVSIPSGQVWQTTNISVVLEARYTDPDFGDT